MNREDIKRWMLEKSGLPVTEQNAIYLERFAALVAAAEREECAKLCEQHAAEPMILRYMKIDDSPRAVGAMDCAALIRMRSEQA